VEVCIKCASPRKRSACRGARALVLVALLRESRVREQALAERAAAVVRGCGVQRAQTAAQRREQRDEARHRRTVVPARARLAHEQAARDGAHVGVPVLEVPRHLSEVARRRGLRRRVQRRELQQAAPAILREGSM